MTSLAASEATGMHVKTLMYHYVRPLPDPHFPELRGRSVEEFEAQVEMVAASGEHVWSMEELLDLSERGAPVPDRGWLFTFDDGLRDHLDHAAPVLEAAGFRGAFFPSGFPVKEQRSLRSQKIQIILACGAPPQDVLDRTVHLLSERLGEGELDEWRERADRLANFRLNDPVTARAKFLLQNALPQSEMDAFLDGLLEAVGTLRDPELFDDLYLTRDGIVELQARGHFVGTHGMEHIRYGLMTESEALADLDASLKVLSPLGVDSHRTAIIYPYGSEPIPEARVLFRARGVLAGFTIVARNATPDDDWLLIPRWDTNDFPPGPRYGR
jgi:peptidoglycan/xylan/chitin deacetylase (PgdA/CDA1 family)